MRQLVKQQPINLGRCAVWVAEVYMCLKSLKLKALYLTLLKNSCYVFCGHGFSDHSRVISCTYLVVCKVNKLFAVKSFNMLNGNVNMKVMILGKTFWICKISFKIMCHIYNTFWSKMLDWKYNLCCKCRQ